MIPSDAGRPISDITTYLRYPELAADAQETMRTLVYREETDHHVTGSWFSVRIMPYRRLDNRIDGVVIAFVTSPPPKRWRRNYGRRKPVCINKSANRPWNWISAEEEIFGTRFQWPN